MSAPARQCIKAPETAIALLKRAVRASGLSLAEIAQRAGIQKCTAQMVNSGYLLTPKMRLRWENALGRAIWSTRREFSRRRALAAWLGFDPLLTARRTLIERAADKGITFKVRCPSRVVITAQLFEAFAAAHPQKPRARS